MVFFIKPLLDWNHIHVLLLAYSFVVRCFHFCRFESLCCFDTYISQKSAMH